ncbi:MAG TPA: bifunctional precorrin-2 dehydrogenase/sirohydrochlorin ferrochelatase [Gemmataceae bacterium]|nr:bifunctional precorrin-2 dehydrogenase/sirohydrochlorin ferrochelatase [Gemmataceae bacterium]
MLPLVLNLKDRLAVVIGGGPVGRRKASTVLAAGGHVRLICLEPRPAEMSDPLLDWRTETYSADHLADAALVFAAGPAELNAQVVADARARSLWVNAASEPAQGDFFLPATVRRGDFMLAVSTGGAAPILTQTVRAQLETQFDEMFGVWVALLAELRPRVMERSADAEQRRNVLTRLCQWEWLERLRREDRNTVRGAMCAEIEAIIGERGV